MITVTADSAHSSESGAPRSAIAGTPPDARVSFDRLVAEHQARIGRLAQRLLGWPDADVEDVVQEVFIAAWKNLAKFRGDSSVLPWLTRLTINACRRYRRQRLLRLALLTRLAEHKTTAGPPGIGDAIQRDERLAQVRSAVRRLPAKYREVIVLRYLEELDVPEIMSVLGVRRSAVDVRLHRARALLGEQLKVMADS